MVVAPLIRCSGKRILYQWILKIVEGEMLVNTGRSRMVRNKLSWKYRLILIVWTRWSSPLHNQRIIWEDQIRGWLPLWVSVPKVQTRKKRQGFPLLTLLIKISGIFFGRFNNSPYLGYKIKQVHNEPTEDYFFPIEHITKLMKSESGVWSNFLKLVVNENIRRINKAIIHINEEVKY